MESVLSKFGVRLSVPPILPARAAVAGALLISVVLKCEGLNAEKKPSRWFTL